MRKSLWIVLAVMVLAVGAPKAQADTTVDLNIPGIGLIPVESSMIFPTLSDCGITIIGPGSGGTGGCLEVFRKVDSFSPAIFDATVTGAMFSTGSLETFDSSFSSTIPITSFVMTDILFTSIQHSGTNENPMESDTLQFATGTLVNNVPEPASLMLLGSALLGLAGIKRRRSGC